MEREILLWLFGFATGYLFHAIVVQAIYGQDNLLKFLKRKGK